MTIWLNIIINYKRVTQMTKKLSAVILAVILAASLFGCTKSKNADYDADKIADALSIGLEFGEQLEKSTTEIACSYYGIDSALCLDKLCDSFVKL